mgnify:CR=1 FL=1
MKRKSIITVLALVLVLALSLSLFSACNKKHKYSSEWKFDEKTHWHECTTKNHTDTTEKTPHVFTWTEKTPAGVHTDKVEKGVCECGYETERTISDTATHVYGEEWKKDATGHWHESTCDAKAPTHDVMKSDFAAHTFGEGEVTKPADYGVVGEKKFTCTVCGYEKTEPIEALGAKDNEIALVAGKTLGKEYDGEVVSITKDDFVINGNREPAIMFKAKGADDNTYTATAPNKAGEYTVKVSVAATAEGKSATKTFDFEITKKPLTEEIVKQEYDGRSFIIGEPKGKVGSDDVQIKVMMSGKDVGATKESVALIGDDAGNYSITLNDVTASIIKKDITKDIPHMNYFYNATTSLFLYNGSTGGFGTVKGDAVIIRIIFESKDVGTTKITGVSITGVASGNYVIDHTKLSGTIVQTSLGLVGINFKIFKFGDNYYSVPLKVTNDHVDISGFNDDVTIKMVKYNGTHAIGETWTLTNADEDCFEITGADAKNYKKVMFSDEEDFACTATLAVDESMPELTNAVYNKELKAGTYWYKKELGAGYKTLDYAQNKMKITVYKSDGNKATVIDNEMLVPDQTTIYLYIEVREEASRGPRVTNSTTHAELTIGTTYELPKAPNTHNLGKKHFLKVNLPQNGYYQITKQKFYSSDSIKFYDEQGKQITPLKCTNRTHDSANDTYSDYIYTIANFSDSVKVIYISITVYDKNSVNGITVSSTKSYAVSETGKYLRYETKYLSAQLDAGKITINENNSTVLSARKLTYKVYDANLKEIKMNADGTFDIPANGEYLIEVSNLTAADIESVTFRIV